MSDIIVLIYTHKHSAPSPSSPLYSERHALFSPSVSPALLLRYLMLVLPYSHGQPTLSLHAFIRRSYREPYRS
ncbi:uncharacterized protein LACBIDRAFT_303571 [Laccaria bicolor S238N-H82]|uniref:Predicted protein n=1 Tax=Laccaria bicolor (strain S238N-H82 / ATCC MYA-4686) TaxID=486041 RepID=B0DJR5_LACBS|nr:uncharacterized protein LACBIDRAFT_303571 [Laccaria bicolor S238N-H82]EDR05164.1 predicted protein [Laccaria bicolor S238N-H82]|eukprot:XP_001884129.1 predicted protein [Laccaria bicolor S238N-H82]